MSVEQEHRRWVVLYTRPRHEKKVHDQLCRGLFECYLPLYMRVRQWSDRKKEVAEPLFPCYVFIHTTERERLAAIQTSGVVRCLMMNRKVAVVQETEIENIKRLLNEQCMLEVHPSVVVGAKVKIVSGPLAGMEGIVTTIRGRQRFAVTIEALSRSIVVEVAGGNLVEIA